MIRLLFLFILLYINILWSFSQVFTVDGRKLIDANGEEFLIRGVNNPHIWFPRHSYKSLETIAAFNANCIRIVWDAQGKPGKLKKIIRKCIELELIPMVELHDVTGKTTTDTLMRMVDYFKRSKVKDLLLRYEKYLLLNIANEWGDHHTTSAYWRDTYAEAVDSLRKAGYTTTIVIDAPGWGQNLQPVLEYGNALLEHDPLHNLLFSIHMYGSWNNAEKIKNDLQKAYEADLPLIVGEFGYNHNNGMNNLGCEVDQKVILETCSQLQYGYIPWSWTGNNQENAWLDMAEPKNWKVLTEWGESVIDGEYGIRRTGEKASVFTD